MLIDQITLNRIVNGSELFDGTPYCHDPKLLYSVAKLNLTEVGKIRHFTKEKGEASSIPLVSKMQEKDLREGLAKVENQLA